MSTIIMPKDFRIELGQDHWIELMGWHPNRALNPKYARWPDLDHAGAIVGHPGKDGRGECVGAIRFRVPPEHPLFRGAQWDLLSVDPIHITPSLLCSPDKGGCGDHGWVRFGLWVPA